MKKLLLTLFMAAAVQTSFSQSKTHAVEQLNVNNFHLVDFVGWNTNMAVLAHYHTNDVKVFGDGFSTDGMKDHEAMMEKSIAQMPDAKVIQHFPVVAKGEWTGVVGLSPQFNMATLAKWKNGKIAYEYLFYKQLSAAEALTIKPSAKPTVAFVNPNDSALADAVNVQPNWTCIMDDVKGKRTAFFIKTVNGKEVERLVFQ